MFLLITKISQLIVKKMCRQKNEYKIVKHIFEIVALEQL